MTSGVISSNRKPTSSEFPKLATPGIVIAGPLPVAENRFCAWLRNGVWNRSSLTMFGDSVLTSWIAPACDRSTNS